MLTKRTKAKIDAIEIQEESYKLGYESIKYNNLQIETKFQKNLSDFFINKR